MRQLFWKEWHELRLLPLAAVVCITLLLLGTKAYQHLTGGNQPLQLGDLYPALIMTWGLFSLLTGASLIAPEVGSGGLVFLSILPISRRRVWAVKVSAMLVSLALTLLLSGMTWALIAPALTYVHAPGGVWHRWLQPDPGTFLIALLLLDIFATALAVSPFLDRLIGAVIASGLVLVVCYGALAFFANWYLMHHFQAYTEHLSPARQVIPSRHDFQALFTIIAALPVPVLLAVSYWTFTRGESLRSAKRFRVGALTGAVSVALAFAVFWSGSWLRWW